MIRKTLASGGVAVVFLASAVAGAQPALAANPSCTDLFDPASGQYIGATTGQTTLCDVPVGVTYYDFVVRGGWGGNPGGVQNQGAPGAKITGGLAVTAGETLSVVVAGNGLPGWSSSTQSYVGNSGSGGGGSSSLARGATAIVVAGGGGGSGTSSHIPYNPSGGAAGAGSSGASSAAAGAIGNYNAGDQELNGGAGAVNGTGGAGGLSVSYGNQFGYGGSGGNAGANGIAGGAGSYGVGGGAGGGGFGGTSPISTLSGCSGSFLQYAGSGGYPNGGQGCYSGGGGGGYAGGGGGATVNGTGAGGGGGSSLVPVGAVAVVSGTGVDLNPRVELVVGVNPNPPAPPAPTPSGGGSSTSATVTIGFNANGGVGAVAAVTGAAGTWATAPSAAGLTRDGYTFAGWNTAADGAGTAVAAGGAILLSASNTLFAQWQAVATSPANPSLTGALGPNTSLVPGGGLGLGDSVLTSNGAPVGVTVAPNVPTSPRSLVVSSLGLTPALNMRLEGRGDDADPLGLTGKQALVLQSEPVATRAGVISARTSTARAKVQPVAQSSGDGFMGNSEVRFYLLADTYLGTLTTAADGSYNGSVPIPAGIVPGVYTLQVNGFSPTGDVRSLSIGVQIVAASTPRPTQSAKATVYFAPMSATLSSGAKSVLTSLLRRTDNGGVRTVVIGYVQPVGGTANDKSLSTARARTVAAFLKQRGLRGAYTVSGNGRAKQTGATARRVEITVTFRR